MNDLTGLICGIDRWSLVHLKESWAPRLIHILLRIATVEQHFQLLFVCNKAIFRGALLFNHCKTVHSLISIVLMSKMLLTTEGRLFRNTQFLFFAYLKSVKFMSSIVYAGFILGHFCWNGGLAKVI
jgi:hypothetical protein